jgi:phage tail sheath protein FI
MSPYSSPGVYVEEIPSGSAPLAGVGTSTAGFIGIVPDTVEMSGKSKASEAAEKVPVTAHIEALIGGTLAEDVNFTIPETIETGLLTAKSAKLIKQSNLTMVVIGKDLNISTATAGNLENKIINEELKLSNEVTLKPGDRIPADSKTKITTALAGRPTLKIQVEQNLSDITENDLSGQLLIKEVKVPSEYKAGTVVDYELAQRLAQKIVDAAGNYVTVVPDGSTGSKESFILKASVTEVKVCTNFSEFKNDFGDFSSDPGQNKLAHAVYGFFRNGGTRCYVVRVTTQQAIQNVLENQFEAIDEIALVAAPGITDKGTLDAIADHCKKMGDRFAILDCPESSSDSRKLKSGGDEMPSASDYAALYYPWLQVYDPASKTNKTIPPSGHIAGIYARVDTQRGVHKAPANETVLGAVGLEYNLSKAKQDGLNPQGVNCIRNLNGSIRVWGARTWGGDANGEFKYISTRRLFNYLRESIDEGTQWTVFEPNSPELWAAIRRNATAFLTTVWRSGALFGNTPEQAFYVKCDEETNPPALREQGQVVTEIGVAVVKPAEFVIFRLSQWAGGQG